MKTQTWKHLAIALVGSVALGAGTGCASFWAASAPERSSNQEMEEATPIEDTATEGDEDAETEDTEPDEMESSSGATETGGTAGDSGMDEPGAMDESGAVDESGAMDESGTSDTGSASDMTAMKMTVSSMGAESVTADLYWDVADNKALGNKELKLQLVDANSGAELKACREIKVSADQQSFMGERSGIEVEKRAERLTTYLPQDALDKLAAANTVTLFVCEYKFLLGPSQQSKIGDLRKKAASQEADPADADTATTDEAGTGETDTADTGSDY
ncbi:MAG: hypothetical protein ACQEVA_00110 [Myxococcota bacterium]